MIARASSSRKYGISLPPRSRARGPERTSDSQHDPVLESLRQSRLAQRHDEGVEAAAELQPVAAVEARLQVGLDRVERLAGDRAIQIGEELPHRLVAGHPV